MNHWFSFQLSAHRPKRPVGQYMAAAALAVALAAVGTASVTLSGTQQTVVAVQPESSKMQTVQAEQKVGTDKATAQENAQDAQAQQAAGTADVYSDAQADAQATEQGTSESTAAPEYVVTPVTKQKKTEQSDQSAETQSNAQTEAAAQAEEAAAPETEAQAPRLEQSTAALEAEDQEPTARVEMPTTPLDESNGEDETTQETQEAQETQETNETADADTDDLAKQLLQQGVVLLTPEDLEQAGYGSVEELQADEENCLRWLFSWLFGTKYSGWHTSAGRTYYYDPKTNEIVKGVQNIDGKLYYFGTDGVLQDVTFGIDVSRYQQSVNWNKVKKVGVEFVIIRIGYRGYQSGTLVLDSMYETHMQNAKAAGLKVGVYFFSQAINEDEAIEEAEACVYVLQTLGHTLDYPIYFDSEYATSNHSGRADTLSVAQRTACAVAFCESIQKAGYKAGVYASTNWFKERLVLSQLTKYSIWNAHYQVNKSGIDCDIWQSTGTGTLDGISGQVDINVQFNSVS